MKSSSSGRSPGMSRRKSALSTPTTTSTTTTLTRPNSAGRRAPPPSSSGSGTGLGGSLLPSQPTLASSAGPARATAGAAAEQGTHCPVNSNDRGSDRGGDRDGDAYSDATNPPRSRSRSTDGRAATTATNMTGASRAAMLGKWATHYFFGSRRGMLSNSLSNSLSSSNRHGYGRVDNGSSADDDADEEGQNGSPGGTGGVTGVSVAGEYHYQRQRRRRRNVLFVMLGMMALVVFYASRHHWRNLNGRLGRVVGSSGDGDGVLSSSSNAGTGAGGNIGGAKNSGKKKKGNPLKPTYRNGRSRPRAFVCITGQLPRLELANKIQNLFVPWHHQRNVEFDVALVLTDTHHISVERQGHREQQYYHIRQVYDELSSLPGVRVLNSDIDTQAQNPILNPHYMRQRGHDSTMNSTQLLERVQNHVRQFESLARCHYHMSASEMGGSESYDIVHRVRDDSGYFRNVDFDHLYDLIQMQPMTIVSSDCEYHGGINDRGSFVSPDAAYDYFNHPILHMYTKPLPEEVRNTEQFLMVTYARSCRLIQTDSFHLFRLWEFNNTVSFSDSDIKCIDRKAEHGGTAIHKRKRICHEFESDGNTYCVHLDKAGLTYSPDDSAFHLPGATATDETQDDDVVWDKHAAKEVAIAAGFVVSDFDDDDDVDNVGGPAKRAEEDWTDSSSEGDDALPKEQPDSDPDAEFELDGTDDDGYHTLESGDDLDKIAAKKFERKKRRKEERAKNKGLLAEAAGVGDRDGDEEEEEEDLPEEMRLPDERRKRRWLVGPRQRRLTRRLGLRNHTRTNFSSQ